MKRIEKGAYAEAQLIIAEEKKPKLSITEQTILLLTHDLLSRDIFVICTTIKTKCSKAKANAMYDEIIRVHEKAKITNQK